MFHYNFEGTIIPEAHNGELGVHGSHFVKTGKTVELVVAPIKATACIKQFGAVEQEDFNHEDSVLPFVVILIKDEIIGKKEVTCSMTGVESLKDIIAAFFCLAVLIVCDKIPELIEEDFDSVRVVFKEVGEKVFIGLSEPGELPDGIRGIGATMFIGTGEEPGKVGAIGIGKFIGLFFYSNNFVGVERFECFNIFLNIFTIEEIPGGGTVTEIIGQKDNGLFVIFVLKGGLDSAEILI
jgi:hypothetical protein